MCVYVKVCSKGRNFGLILIFTFFLPEEPPETRISRLYPVGLKVHVRCFIHTMFVFRCVAKVLSFLFLCMILTDCTFLEFTEEVFFIFVKVVEPSSLLPCIILCITYVRKYTKLMLIIHGVLTLQIYFCRNKNVLDKEGIF